MPSPIVSVKSTLTQFAAISPVQATSLRDHRFDGELDEVSDAAWARKLAWLADLEDRLKIVDRQQILRANQVDLALLKHSIKSQTWKLTELQEWRWISLTCTGLSGDAVYGVMSRDFSPHRERLVNVAKRLEQFPRFFDQVRSTLDMARVPDVHARTTAAQNLGIPENHLQFCSSVSH